MGRGKLAHKFQKNGKGNVLIFDDKLIPSTILPFTIQNAALTIKSFLEQIVNVSGDPLPVNTFFHFSEWRLKNSFVRKHSSEDL